MTDGPQSIVIVGPTGSGKTALAIEVAAALGDCEIVSVDSMQVYRGMDIGTAKATAHERSLVPHHLIDVVDPDHESSVGWFQQLAAEAVASIHRRGHRVIFVGGTGLYHRAVVDGLTIPGEYPDVRAQLDPESTEDLHRHLHTLDPEAAARIEPTNRRRTLRALEVNLGSGRRFSDFGPGLEHYPSTPHRLVGLSLDRDGLLTRYERRVATMMELGFLDEVRQLRRASAPISRTAAQALGYRELSEHLAGNLSLEDAVEQTVRRTRQFAVRQDRWFRRDPRIDWFPAETRSLAETIAGTVGHR